MVWLSHEPIRFSYMLFFYGIYFYRYLVTLTGPLAWKWQCIAWQSRDPSRYERSILCNRLSNLMFAHAASIPKYPVPDAGPLCAGTAATRRSLPTTPKTSLSLTFARNVRQIPKRTPGASCTGTAWRHCTRNFSRYGDIGFPSDRGEQHEAPPIMTSCLRSHTEKIFIMRRQSITRGWWQQPHTFSTQWRFAISSPRGFKNIYQESKGKEYLV